MVIGVALLAALWCLLPAGAAAAGDSDQSVAVTFNLCPGSGPMACAGLRVYVDSASNHYRPSQKYSYCTGVKPVEVSSLVEAGPEAGVLPEPERAA